MTQTEGARSHPSFLSLSLPPPKTAHSRENNRGTKKTGGVAGGALLETPNKRLKIFFFRSCLCLSLSLSHAAFLAALTASATSVSSFSTAVVAESPAM